MEQDRQLKAQVEELTRKLAESEAARKTVEGKLATTEEARTRAGQGNWRLREVEKSLRAELARLNGPSGPAAQLKYVKDKLTAVGHEARALYATATTTIATQAQAVRSAGDRVAVLEAALGADLEGRPFAVLLTQAAQCLDDGGGGSSLADALLAKAGEVEAVQAHAQAPVQVAPTPGAELLPRLLVLLGQESLAEMDFETREFAAAASAFNQAMVRVCDRLRALQPGAQVAA